MATPPFLFFFFANVGIISTPYSDCALGGIQRCAVCIRGNAGTESIILDLRRRSRDFKNNASAVAHVGPYNGLDPIARSCDTS